MSNAATEGLKNLHSPQVVPTQPSAGGNGAQPAASANATSTNEVTSQKIPAESQVTNGTPNGSALTRFACNEAMPDMIDLVSAAVEEDRKVPFLPSVITAIAFTAINEAARSVRASDSRLGNTRRPPPVLRNVLKALPFPLEEPRHRSQPKRKVSKISSNKNMSTKGVMAQFHQLDVPTWPFEQKVAMSYEWGQKTALGLGVSTGTASWNRILLKLGMKSLQNMPDVEEAIRVSDFPQVSPLQVCDALKGMAEDSYKNVLHKRDKRVFSVKGVTEGTKKLILSIERKLAKLHAESPEIMANYQAGCELLTAKQMCDRLSRLSQTVRTLNTRKERLCTKLATRRKGRASWKTKLKELRAKENQSMEVSK